MHEHQLTQPAGPKPWLIVSSVLLFTLLLLGSLGLALCGAASYSDSYSHDAERQSGLVALAAAGSLFLASISSLAFLVVRKPAVWSVAVGLLVLTLLSIGGLIVAGMGMMAAAQRRGGDWGGFAVFGSLLFGIVFPALVGLLGLGGGACMLAMRRQIEKAESSPRLP